MFLKKIISAILIFMVVSLIVPAAMCSNAPETTGPAYEWIKFIEPEEVVISSVWQLSDGSYVAGGQGENGRELLGLDKSGEIIWTKDVPGGDGNGSVRFVQESPSGGLYIFTDGENLIKTTESGDVLWTYHQPIGVISSIEVADTGDVLMAGNYFQSFLTMISSEGSELWNRSLGSPQGGGQYRLSSVQGAPDGGFIIAGSINPIMSTENYCGFVMKTDADGNQEWARQYRYDDSVLITSITPLADSGYAAGVVEVTDQAISLNEDNAGYASYILILDSEGEIVSKELVPDSDVIYHIKSAPDGGYYLLAKKYDTLTDSTDYGLIRVGADASHEWAKSFGGIKISALHKTDDGGLLLSGTDESAGEGVIIKMLPDDAEVKRSPGFGIIISVCAVLCTFCLLNRRRIP